MKILVTGGSGFIGSKLTKYLDSKGHKVYAIARNGVKSKNVISTSLLDKSKLNSLFKKNHFDIIIHLAALLDDGKPSDVFNNNCQSTINLLECCNSYHVKKIVFASTHAVYGSTKYIPIDEKHSTTPITNYSISKLIAENINKMYSNSYGMNIINLRITSVYGPGQSSNYLIPKMINSCIKDKTIILHKYLNGYQIMDLIHVDDVCKSIELACKSNVKSGTYNIASGVPITVYDISQKLSKILGTQKIIIKKIPKETNHFYYDISAAKNDLGFIPKLQLSTKTLTDVIDYVKKQR